MQKIAVVAIFVASCFTLTHGQRNLKAFCKSKRRPGNYQSPTNCNQYIVCTPYYVYITSCPQGMQFNIRKNRCDWKSNVKCQEACEDKEDCTLYKPFCKDKMYAGWMKENCKETCGICKVSRCSDDPRYVYDCTTWKNRGFCTKSDYLESMKAYCSKTCQFCGKPVPPPPVDGGYGPWTKWQKCSKKCGGGNQRRMRACNSPVPANGGAPCKGKSLESRPCNINPCLIPGGKAPCHNTPQYSKYCISWAPYCKKGNQYYGFMRQHCRQTCGFCDKVAPPPLPKVTGGTVGSCGVDKSIKTLGGRVVGGVDAYPHRWVWQGGMYYWEDFVCGGSLISDDIFITAAHCVATRGEEGMVIKMGDHKRFSKDGPEQERKVKKIIVHAGWNTRTVENDIAILKLEKKFKLNSNVGTICLPAYNEMPKKDDVKCFITGWGKTAVDELTADILQEAELPIVPNKVCGMRNQKDGKSRIKQTMICGGYKNADSIVSGCMGDSGGPYVCKKKNDKKAKWFLQGVVSWGSRMCKASHRFTVFTRVSKYIKWINNKMKELKEM